MTDEEPSVRDKIMELYIKYGEREFEYPPGLGLEALLSSIAVTDDNYLWNGPYLRTKLTRKALKLIREET